MAQNRIGVARIDGREYDLPHPETLTFREYGLIKRWVGLRAGELEEALQAGDTDPIVAFIVLGMRRAGHKVEPDFILDMDPKLIQVEIDDDEEPADPPVAGAAENSPTSGTATPESGGTPDSSSSSASAPGSSMTSAPTSSTS